MTLYIFFLTRKDGRNISKLREGVGEEWAEGARALLRPIHSCFDETKKKEKTGLERHLRKKSLKKEKKKRHGK